MCVRVCVELRALLGGTDPFSFLCGLQPSTEILIIMLSHDWNLKCPPETLTWTAMHNWPLEAFLSSWRFILFADLYPHICLYLYPDEESLGGSHLQADLGDIVSSLQSSNYRNKASPTNVFGSRCI